MKILFMAYICFKMEYCKGRTLKDVIDKMLYKDVDKVWSLFREILQGLNHIHELVFFNFHKKLFSLINIFYSHLGYDT